MEYTDLVILISAGLAVISVFTSIIAFRAGAPLLLFFLAIGLIAGRDGPGGLVFTDSSGGFLIGSAGLAAILFDSGFHTRFRSYRQAAGPALALSSAGVLLTALLVALPAHYLLEMPWPLAALMGTILSSTDAAALFFLLRVGGITIRDRVRSTLEVESGMNDPVAAVLAVSLVAPGLVGGHGVGLLAAFTLKMGIGVVAGLAGGALIVLVVSRTRLEPGLAAVAVLCFALTLFALTDILGGSGFLAAYLAGIVAGNTRLPGASTLRKFQDGLTWLAQIAMFITLGLLAGPHHFPGLVRPALLLAACLIFIARPLAVLVCLAPFRFTVPERLFISWVGLRGAVSILLALLPTLADMPGAEMIFNLCFLVVIGSLALQGWTVKPLARRLGLIVPEPSGPVERMEIDLPGLANRDLVGYVLHAESPVLHGRPLPRWARPLIVQRGGRLRNAPNRLMAGDHVYLLAGPRQLPLLDRLFGRGRDDGEDETRIWGDFAMAPEVRLFELADAYGLKLALSLPDQGLTLAELFRREFRNDLEIGDRINLGPVDLILRELDEEKIVSIGIALEPAQKPEQIWRKRIYGLLGG